jgi:hypothetical protein
MGGVGNTESDNNRHHKLDQFGSTGYGTVEDITEEYIYKSKKHHYGKEPQCYVLYKHHERPVQLYEKVCPLLQPHYSILDFILLRQNTL